MGDDINDQHKLTNPPAIQLTDVTVRLGKKDVLRSINLVIEQGGIFALLGPSGCGKTSLIRTLVGRLHPVDNHDGTRGTLFILGEHPHAFGQHVGFMPQETALHLTNTIDEELFFYGRLANMPSQKIQQRCQFLTNLLELSNRRKLISKLSGGQQRRVSFAIALLHEPQLLILDEPTVGVDPILRKKIWQHLTEITIQDNITTILTTHYIEEARQAHTVSFMRHGQILETGKPNELLLKHQQQTLEGVFLELCEGSHILELQHHEQEKIHHHKSITIANKICHSCHSTVTSCCMKSSCCDTLRSCARPSLGRSLYALLIKDVIKFQRNPFMLVIHFLVPILQITLFCLCVGRKLTDIPMGFISREPIQPSSLSGLVFEKMDKNVVNLIQYKSIDEAQQRFSLGYLSGFMDIGANFSRQLVDKMDHCSFSEANKYNDSQVTVYFDPINRLMVYAIAEEFIRVFKSIDADLHLGFLTPISSNHMMFKLGRFKNDLMETEYSFTYFMAPGILLSVIFFMNVALTALSLVIEQNDGTQERTWITGVKTNEIILSQLMVHSVVLLIQIVIVLFTSLYILEIPLKGSLICSTLICVIQGFCGMTFGLVISTIFTTEVNAHQVTIVTFYPVLLLSGIVWPLEGQPRWMRTFTRWLPVTKATEALRGILLKGWGIEHLIVQQAFLVTFMWTLFFLILTLFIFNCRRL